MRMKERPDAPDGEKSGETRRALLIVWLQAERALRVRDAALHFKVSHQTVVRDLAKLALLYRLEQVPGGVLMAATRSVEQRR